MERNLSFSVKITEEDLYRFNLYHAYKGSQGILSVVLFVLLIFVWILRFYSLSLAYRLLYPFIAVIFLLYIPYSLKLRVKNQMQQDVFRYPLNYALKEDGIAISSPASEEPAMLPWEYIYKVSTWKGYLLIYSNRVNAYIIPISDVQDKYADIIAVIKSHVEDYKLKIK